jgi:very-short-patch-repair endonuclease
MPHSAIEPRTRRQAQALRHRTTDAEQKLWRLLRSLKPLGFHFRRQAPIGPYIADFVWYAGRLVIELDGGQHADLQRERDDRRTAWLETQGFQVLRFWNNDVLKSVATVGEVILAAANERQVAEPAKHPTPDPSPQGGGERSGASGNSIGHRARPNRLDASAKQSNEKNSR